MLDSDPLSLASALDSLDESTAVVAAELVLASVLVVGAVVTEVVGAVLPDDPVSAGAAASSAAHAMTKASAQVEWIRIGGS